MSEPLKRVSFKHITDDEEAINYLGEALQSAIERINELEAKYEGHTHQVDMQPGWDIVETSTPIEDTTGEGE